MKTINLRKLYFSQYHEDVFVEVSDEVAEALLLMKRAENNRRQKINYYKAYYSIDCVDGIEMAAIHGEQLSPEDYLIELAEQDEWNTTHRISCERRKRILLFFIAPSSWYSAARENLSLPLLHIAVAQRWSTSGTA